MSKEINLEHISKIEGHAKLHILIDKSKIKKVELKIFEGSRYFEGLTIGKNYKELPYVTSRICGICSPAHTICSIQAIESALGIKVSKQTQILREIIMCSGHIQSHVAHLYFLALPDYLGIESMLQVMKKHKSLLERALRLKKIASHTTSVIGGRDIHPFSSIIGGFSATPTQKQINELVKELKKAIPDVIETIKLFEKLKSPKFTRKTKYFGLENIQLTHGQIRDEKKKIHKLHEEFKQFFQPDSYAEYSKLNEKPYMVGALARLNQSKELLPKQYQKHFPSNNPFDNNLAQAIEILFFLEKIIKLLKNLKIKKEKPVKLPSEIKSFGMSSVEAPRGILFHQYSFDKNGICTKCDITTPTTQNLKQIEYDIKKLLPGILNKPKEEIQLNIEKLIRAYDPCISCATHFLTLDIEQIK